MADLLTRIKPDALMKDLDNLGAQVWRVVDGKKEEFDLQDRLRDGSVVFGGYEVIKLQARERPFVRTTAESRAVKLAEQYGFDYAMLIGTDLPTEMDGPDIFLAQFYLNAQK